ncbi:MAG TPA: LuxR C-terminal-related transcriptional regulator, partial [Pyrinomonadaceae bacterium]|nr:LuxR C-terminal-related transcriptional regulator [Pyrinomonadaceae bacterium]
VKATQICFSEFKLTGSKHAVTSKPKLSSRLTLREMEIARLVAQGKTNAQIAKTLGVSSWTVGMHLRRIFAKLSVNSRTAMVARLIEKGLLAASHKRSTSRQ